MPSSVPQMILPVESVSRAWAQLVTPVTAILVAEALVPTMLVKFRVVMVPLADMSSVEEATPKMSTFPPPLTLNLVEELTWRSMKLPVKLVGFAARYVPVADPPWMRLGPSNMSDEVAAVGGEPVSSKAVWPLAVPRILPSALTEPVA